MAFKKVGKVQPREVIDWDSYFLDLCFNVATRSKDPSTQHGAVLVDKNHRIVSTGYNGAARNFPDHLLSWDRSKTGKYAWVIHAEENALWNARRKGCVLYVTGPPCSNCMMRIANAGIKKIIHGKRQSNVVDEDIWQLSLKIADLAKIKLTSIDRS